MTNLTDSLEESLVAILTATAAAHSYTDAEGNSNAVPVYCGKASPVKSLPNVRCEASGAGDEDPPFSGNFWVDAVVMVRYIARQNPNGTDPNAADPKTAEKLLSSAIANVLADDGLAAALNAAALAAGLAFTAYSPIIRGAQQTSAEPEGAWVDEFPLRVYCCASTLA